MRKKLILLIAIYFSIIFLVAVLINCGSYNFNRSIERTTYISGQVILPNSVINLISAAPPINNQNNKSFSSTTNIPLVGAKVYVNYGGVKYETTTDANGNFKLYLDENIISKNVYLIKVEKGIGSKTIRLFLLTESDNYGNINNCLIDHNSTLNYLIYKNFLNQYKNYYLKKENLNYSILNEDNVPIKRILLNLIENEIPITELETNQKFLSILKRGVNNLNGVIATIPYNGQKDFFAYDEVKILFGTEMDTTINWQDFLSFNYAVISSNNVVVEWDTAGRVLTIKPGSAVDKFLINKELIFSINEKLKTSSGQKIAPYQLKFYTTDIERFDISDYFILDNYYEYKYNYQGEYQTITKDITQKLMTPQILNSKQVQMIGEDYTNYQTFTCDENGLLLHSEAIYTYTPPVKLTDKICYKGSTYSTNNSGGNFISTIIEKTYIGKYTDVLKIELKVKYSNENFYRQKFLYFAKGVGLIKEHDVGYYNKNLNGYYQKIELIEPDTNTILDTSEFKIEWKKASSLNRYKIEFSKNQNFTIINKTEIINGNSLNINLNDTGNYYFRIIALTQDSQPYLYSDTFNIYITQSEYLNPANEIENAFGNYVYQKSLYLPQLSSDTSYKYFLVKSPNNMFIDYDTGLIIWSPEPLNSGLFNVLICLTKPSILDKKIYYYNYKIYQIPASFINSFTNYSETFTFYEDNTFIKKKPTETYTGKYYVYYDTIVFNYFSPITYTETGTNLYIGYDSISYMLNYDKKIYNLIISETTIIDTSLEPVKKPIIISTPKTTAYVEQYYIYWLKVQPVLYNEITYQLLIYPEGMTVDANGLIFWKPTNQFKNKEVNVTIKVIEKNVGYSTQTFSINVK
ncbi:MAG TPA: carboxypeptidase-like regulatory domain-containing protein [bacterium]|nr:carboxypeptidase-like regulatory domain-containing protein [bacterium]HOL46869.1 carboxypeptidase-like regulatory domain-containing protein [bacterium]